VDLGINKASLHHTLSVLRQRGFVEQNIMATTGWGARRFHWPIPICTTTAFARCMGR
jgi:hypothetical protein